ncbi:DNA replication and repair protein RecF [Candidatus Kapaibacterium sp.]
MKINELHISNFRNHELSTLKFGNDLNLIRGLNGSGKTTILEAISVCALSKTFQPTQDVGLIKAKSTSYSLKLTAKSDLDIDYKISVDYRSNGRKIFNSSYGDNLLPKEVIGVIPLVILTPDNKNITFGSPGDRRQFLDTILSQSSKKYVDDALRNKKLLKQRNALLSQAAKSGNIDENLLQIISEQFIKCSADIIAKRIKFIYEFKPYFIDTYRYIADIPEVPDIVYLPDSIRDNAVDDVGQITEILNERYQKINRIEKIRGATLFGPQRDDLLFTINGLKSKDSASQGQHKTLLISIKLAEFTFLNEILNETPVLLFDDIFSELDIERSNKVFSRVIENKSQTIITMTNSERLMGSFSSKAVFFDITEGKVQYNDE